MTGCRKAAAASPMEVTRTSAVPRMEHSRATVAGTGSRFVRVTAAAELASVRTRASAVISSCTGRCTHFAAGGPKGYERSDARLREIICERLTDDPRIDASDVSVEVTQKVVRLTGSVDDRRTKYAIEDLIERCGVKDTDNQLRVQSAERPRSRDYSATSPEPPAKRT